MAKNTDSKSPLAAYAKTLAMLDKGLEPYAAKLEFKETQVMRVATRQAARLYDVSVLKAEATKIVGEIIILRDQRENALRTALRANGDKMTEKAVDAALYNDGAYCRLQELLLEARRVEERSASLQAAYKDRSFMIRAVIDTVKAEQGAK